MLSDTYASARANRALQRAIDKRPLSANSSRSPSLPNKIDTRDLRMMLMDMLL